MFSALTQYKTVRDRTTVAGAWSSGLALFGGGQLSGGVTATSEKYRFSDDVVASGTNLGTARAFLAAAGNTTVGVFSQGSTDALDTGKTAVTDRYTFATDGVAAGQSMTETVWGSAAAGNETVGIWAGGQDVLALARTRKYTYATDLQQPGNDLSGGVGKAFSAACGTTTKGYFGAGINGGLQKTVKTYTYATDAVGNGTDLFNAARQQLSACGDLTRGKFRGGFIAEASALSDIYTYSGDTTASSQALGIATDNTPAAAANPTFGLTSGGGNFTKTTVKNPWATDVDAAGTDLAVGRIRHIGVSSTPGHF